MASLASRVRSGWNAFLGRDPTKERELTNNMYYGYSSRPDRVRLALSNQRSVVASVYNRIAVDVSMINMVHAKVDDQNHYQEIEVLDHTCILDHSHKSPEEILPQK